MYKLFIFLLVEIYASMVCLAQSPVPGQWAVGAYSRGHADIFSSGSNPAALAEIRQDGLAIAGQRQYGLKELDVY